MCNVHSAQVTCITANGYISDTQDLGPANILMRLPLARGPLDRLPTAYSSSRRAGRFAPPPDSHYSSRSKVGTKSCVCSGADFAFHSISAVPVRASGEAGPCVVGAACRASTTSSWPPIATRFFAFVRPTFQTVQLADRPRTYPSRLSQVSHYRQYPPGTEYVYSVRAARHAAQRAHCRSKPAHGSYCAAQCAAPSIAHDYSVPLPLPMGSL